MNHKTSALGALLIGALCATASAQAQDATAPIPTITPAPGKTACKAVSSTVADKSLRAELCVTGGSFSSDIYQLKLDGALVLKGIDDQTTPGLKATRDGKVVAMVCTPQEVAPNASAEDIQRVLPGYPAAKTRDLVALMAGSPSGVELGRLCKATVDGAPVLTVQVIFD